MKSCVVTANYACDPNKVWLYLTKPTLNNWRKDVSGYEESDDGMKATEKNTDGGQAQQNLRPQDQIFLTARTCGRSGRLALLHRGCIFPHGVHLPCFLQQYAGGEKNIRPERRMEDWL